MNCSSCKNTNLIKIDFPLMCYCDDRKYMCDQIDAYLCLDCGHIDLFSTTKVSNYNETVAKIKGMQQEIDKLHCQLEQLQNPETAQKIEDQIEKTKIKLEDLDITIRQQCDLKENLRGFQRELSNLPKEIAYIKTKLNDLEHEFNKIESDFEQGKF